MGKAYDLDRAPVILTASRGRMILLLLGVIMFSWLILSKTHASDVVRYLALAFFTLLVLLTGAQVVKRPRLIISPDGLAWAALLRTRRWTWSQIGDFRRASIGVGFDYVDGRLDPVRRWTEASCILLPIWSIKSEELVSLLEQARARWA